MHGDTKGVESTPDVMTHDAVEHSASMPLSPMGSPAPSRFPVAVNKAVREPASRQQSTRAMIAVSQESRSSRDTGGESGPPSRDKMTPRMLQQASPVPP